MKTHVYKYYIFPKEITEAEKNVQHTMLITKIYPQKRVRKENQPLNL